MNSVSVFKTYLLICLIRLFVTPEVSEWEYKVVYAVHFRKTLMIIMIIMNRKTDLFSNNYEITLQ